IREVDGEHGVVLVHRRAQKEGAVASESEPGARQIARALVIETQLTEPHRSHLAEAVEHGEGLALLEHPRAVVDARRAGENVELLLEADDILEGERHQALCAARVLPGRSGRRSGSRDVPALSTAAPSAR